MQAARHSEDQRHGHIGGVIGEHPRRVGDSDAAFERRVDIDIIRARTELRDQFQRVTGRAKSVRHRCCR